MIYFHLNTPYQKRLCYGLDDWQVSREIVCSTQWLKHSETTKPLSSGYRDMKLKVKNAWSCISTPPF